MLGTLLLSLTCIAVGYALRELGLFGELYNIVETTTEHSHSAVVETVKILVNYTLVRMNQILNHSVLYHSDGTCTLQFIISDKLHTFKVFPCNGPASLRETPEERGNSSLRRYSLLRDKWLTELQPVTNEKSCPCNDGEG